MRIDTNLLKEILDDLQVDADELKEIAEREQQIVRECYDYRAISDRYLKLLESL